MKAEMFKELVASVREGGTILRGKVAPSRAFALDGPNIKRIRSQYRLSQGQFAALLGISVGTLRNWEQGRLFLQSWKTWAGLIKITPLVIAIIELILAIGIMCKV